MSDAINGFLKTYIEMLSANPSILNRPDLAFFKKFIEDCGGTIPPSMFNVPLGAMGAKAAGTDGADGAAGGDPSMMDDESAESEVELDMDGVIKPDTEVSQPMGDTSKTPTEEEIDEASEMRSKAAAAYGEQKYDEAIELYTKAIELNPGNALFHAKRGQAYLKQQKPNACIRDCDKALELNCDSAAAYKFRGRANRLLGNWEAAVHDLRQACKLDFDEEADEWLREVTPNAKKLEQHRLKQERHRIEREQKKKSQKPKEAPPMPEMPFQFPKSPEDAKAYMDMLSDPKVAQFLHLFQKNQGKDAASAPPPPAPEAAAAAPEAQPKKAQEYVDDGLD